MGFRLDFQEHWKSLLKKVHKTVAILRKFQNVLPGPVLLTTYKCFVKTHLNYGDIVYDQTFNNSFHQKIESLQLTQFLFITVDIWATQYNAALPITDAIRGSSREKSYQELCL